MAWGMKIQIGISWSRGSISPRIEDETMVNILPFQRTSQLIREIDEFIDKVSEAQMVLEQALLHYFEVGADEGLNQKLAQIGKIEERADELRRNVANMMFSQMLMPDTRGDVLELLGQVDVTLDDCVHIMVDLAIERPTPSGQHVAMGGRSATRGRRTAVFNTNTLEVRYNGYSVHRFEDEWRDYINAQEPFPFDPRLFRG